MATRSTMWDMVFMGIRGMSRNENILEFILRVTMSVLTNITVGKNS